MDQLLNTTAIDQIQPICTPTKTSALPDKWASILIKIDSQPLSRAALAHRVIGWVAHAERPLSIAEIWYAFAFGNNCDRIEEQKLVSMETLIEICHGLVFLDDKDDVVKFLHPSACEFFRTMPGKFEQFQEDIARTCLAYLCLHDMQECFTYRDLESVNNTLRQLPFLAYAAQYWGRHAQRVEQQLAAPIRKLLHDPVLRSSSFQALQHLKSEDLGLDHESLPVGQAPLNIAAYWNLTVTANDILSAGGNSSSADSKGSTPLHWACRNGHVSMVNLLLSYDAGLDIQDWRGWTPLFCAVFSSDAGIVRPLLEKYADHLLVDTKGWTVLHWAVSTGKEETVRALLAYHRDFLAREKPVQILIKEVTLGQAREIVQYAGKKPASDGVLPIEIAARGHDLVMFEVLLQDIALGNAESAERRSKAKRTWPRQQLNEDLQSFNSIWSLKEFDPENWNHLSWIWYDRAETMSGPGYYLMDPLLPEGLYSRALHVAIRDENMMMVRLLLELGADVNYNAVKTSRAPLHTATFRKDPEFARILLQNGANPTLTDHFGRTPLHHAISNGFEKTAAVLMEHGSDVNAGTTADMITPLMLACGIMGQDDDDGKTPLRIVKLLLARGASASLRDKEGRTALHLAVQYCEYEVVLELIAAGADADVHAKDRSQLSVFHYLAKRSQYSTRDDEILDLLIHQYGEGIETKTNLNWQQDLNNAVLLAIKNCCWKIVNTLLQKTSKLPTGALNRQQDLKNSVLLAIKNHCWKIVNTLLQKTSKLPTGATLEGLLSTAVHECQPAAVQFLLEQGAVFDLDSDKSILVSVMLYVDKIEALGQLLKTLPNLSTHVNATKCVGHDLGMTALLVAARNLDSAQAIQFLIDAGANIYQCDNYGQDAFLLAAIHGKLKALRCLLENKAKRPLAEHWLQVPDSQSLSSLPDENLEDLVCYSLLASNLLEIRNQTGKTPLQTAVDLGNTSMVRKLLAQGADLETRDRHGWTPLHNAVHSARRKDDTIIDILLEANADVSAATERWAHTDDGRPSRLYHGDKWTGQALHLAAMFGRERLLKVLLERGADVHASTGSEAGIFPGHGPTALWIVLDTGTFYHRRVGEELDGSRLRIAEMLVERGAVVDGVANHLGLEDVLKFAGFEELWEKLRVGIWEQKGETCQTFLYRKRHTED